MHVALNAHLLSTGAGYRAAGIHGYIDGLLRHLHAYAPAGWRFTAMVGKRYTAAYPGLTMRRAAFDTEPPARRILWEQLIQPWALAGCDLHHALAFVAPLAVSRPFVVTMYDLSFVHYPARLSRARRLYLQLLTKLTCRRARRVIAISHSTARDLTSTLGIPAEKIDIAAPGYDRAQFRPLPADAVAAFRHQKNLPERFWLFVGTLEPRKNLVTLLDAYAALPPASRLPLIIGGGKGWDYQPIFEAVARHNLTAAVQFVGFIPSDQLAFWYNSAEAFLYPSVFEGFGLPVLEAMACGTPVLVSDASSLPEVAGAAGRALPPGDVSAWTEALRAAAEDTAWRQAAREQGFREAARYSWDETARQTIASYGRAVG
jgi:glycosyltransferase involved in cell wall biosynthesis